MPPPNAVGRPSPAPEALASKAYWTTLTRSAPDPIAVPSGRLVLLGGRRAIVRDDGAVTPETQPAPEAFSQIIEVPTAAGDRLVGVGSQTLYRLDGPLGPAVPIATTPRPVAQAGAGPGLIAVWLLEDGTDPIFLDLTGAQVARPGAWPDAPMRGMAFRNEREGVIDFWLAGPRVTTDGGATFRPVSPADAHDALRDCLAERTGNDIQLACGMNRWAVDVASGAATKVPAPDERSLTLRWIQQNHPQIPLASAVRSGIVAGSGHTAVVVAGQTLARVSLETGAVLELIDTQAPGCSLVHARAPGGALLACEDGSVRTLDLDAPLAPRPFAKLLEAEGSFQVSGGRDGALAVATRCAKDAPEESVCALQPDGHFAPVPLPETGDGDRIQLAALSGGRVAYLVALGDDSLSDDDRLRFVVAEATGKITLFPPFKVPRGGHMFHRASVSGDIEEGPDGSIRAIVGGEPWFSSGAFSLVSQPPKGPAVVTDLHAPHAAMESGHAVAVVSGQARVSADQGITWNAVSQAPLGDAWAQRWRWGLDPDGIGPVAAGEVGLSIGDYYRIGWESASAPLSPPPDVPRPPPETKRTGPSLVCASRKTDVPALEQRTTAIHLFDQAAGPASDRSRRDRGDVRWEGSLALTARLEQSAPSRDAKVPTAWTLRWIDERGVPPRPMSWSGAPEPGLGWTASLAEADEASGRLFFAIRENRDSGDVLMLSPRGVVQRQHLDRFDVADVRLGPGDDAPVLWRSASQQALFAWRPGRPPQAAATYDGNWPPGKVAVGRPWHDAVPVVVFGKRRLWAYDVPLASAAKDFDPRGWRSWAIPAEGPPPCDGKSSGATVRAEHTLPTQFTIDGKSVSEDARYTLQLGGSGLCIAEMRASIPGRTGAKEATLGEVVVTLSDGSGRGSEVGPAARRRTLKCTVEGGK